MTTYLAYAHSPSSVEDGDDMFHLLPDQKSGLALIVPVIWLIWHRLWFWLAVYILLMVVISMLMQWFENPAIGLFSLIPGIYLFLEGNRLRARELENRGLDVVGIIEASSEEDAEMKFLAGRRDFQAPLSRPAMANKVQTAKPRPVPAIGIFPE